MMIFKVGEIYECCRGELSGCFLEVMSVNEIPVYGRNSVKFKVYDPVKNREFYHETTHDLAELYGLALWKSARG